MRKGPRGSLAKTSQLIQSRGRTRARASFSLSLVQHPYPCLAGTHWILRVSNHINFSPEFLIAKDQWPCPPARRATVHSILSPGRVFRRFLFQCYSVWQSPWDARDNLTIIKMQGIGKPLQTDKNFLEIFMVCIFNIAKTFFAQAQWPKITQTLLVYAPSIPFCSEYENEHSYNMKQQSILYFVFTEREKISTLIWILNHPEYLAENVFLLFAFLGLACYAFGISADITHNIFFHFIH